MSSKTLKGTLIAGAVCSLFAAGSAFAGSTAAASDVKCSGVNSCKGQGSCKGATNSCKGHPHPQHHHHQRDLRLLRLRVHRQGRQCRRCGSHSKDVCRFSRPREVGMGQLVWPLPTFHFDLACRCDERSSATA